MAVRRNPTYFLGTGQVRALWTAPMLAHGTDFGVFVQVAVKEASVDWRSNCGNLSSAVGPFAVDEGIIIPAPEPGNNSREVGTGA